MNALNPFTFELPTRILFGPGVVRELPRVVAALPARRLLIVSDAGVAAAGLLERVLASLQGTGVAFETFTDVAPNPKEEDVLAGAVRAKACGAEGLVAVGGGSPIDCAKAISVLASLGGEPHDYTGPGNIPAAVLPLIAIPTTAGSGSEVTFSAVLSDAQAGIKFSYRDPKIAPAYALADPEMTITLPPQLTAATGLDALTHAIEAYTATVAEPISDALALQGVAYVSANLARAFRDGTDLAARAGMLMGSLLGGLAFSHADVGAVHCLAETLGGRYDLAHGVCNAIGLPVVMEYNLEYCTARYAQIARAMGLGCADESAGARAAIAVVRRLADEVRLPNFASLGIPVEDHAEIAVLAAANGSNRSNPRPLAPEDYLALLRTLQAGA